MDGVISNLTGIRPEEMVRSVKQAWVVFQDSASVFSASFHWSTAWSYARCHSSLTAWPAQSQLSYQLPHSLSAGSVAFTSSGTG